MVRHSRMSLGQIGVKIVSALLTWMSAIRAYPEFCQGLGQTPHAGLGAVFNSLVTTIFSQTPIDRSTRVLRQQQYETTTRAL